MHRKLRKIVFFIIIITLMILCNLYAGLTFNTIVRDGNLIFNERDKTYSKDTLSANWDQAQDTETGIKRYYYAIGTSHGRTDIKNWTDNGNNTVVTVTNLVLKIGTTYYFSVYAENNQGIKSEINSSNGQFIAKQPKLDVRFLNKEYREKLKSSIKKSKIKALSIAQRASLPTSVKNYKYLPVVGDQGNQGSCSGWAVCYYYKTYQEAKEHGWQRPDPSINPERVMSPAFGYNLANFGEDNGSYPADLMEIIKNHGCAVWQDMPYYDTSYLNWPDENAWKNAINYRGESWAYIETDTDEGITSLKNHLSSDDLAQISIYIYSYFYKDYPNNTTGIHNGVLFDNAGTNLGGHAITIIGYDDTKSYIDGAQTKYGAFLVVNSWGHDWGLNDADIGTKGIMWIAYEYIKNEVEHVLVMTDKNNYSPDKIAIIGLSHSSREDITINFETSPDKKLSFLKHFYSNYGYGGTQTIYGKIVFDVSDIASSILYNTLTLTVCDSIYGQGSAQTGIITSFSIQDLETEGIFISEDTPMNTLQQDQIQLTLKFLTISPNVYVYPNPYMPYKHDSGINFIKLKEDGKIKIFTITGELVCEEKADNTGKVIWNAVNSNGEKAASGIYICYMETENGNKIKKLGIER
ncbi:T9SS type A sorting domain-containing protein [bacterium]